MCPPINLVILLSLSNQKRYFAIEKLRRLPDKLEPIYYITIAAFTFIYFSESGTKGHVFCVCCFISHKLGMQHCNPS